MLTSTQMLDGWFIVRLQRADGTVSYAEGWNELDTIARLFTASF